MSKENNFGTPILTLDIILLNKGGEFNNHVAIIAKKHLEGKVNITTKNYLIKCNDEYPPLDHFKKATIDISKHNLQLLYLKSILQGDIKDPRIKGVPISIQIHYDEQTHHIKIKNGCLCLE
jgi:hypothetical protein